LLRYITGKIDVLATKNLGEVNMDSFNPRVKCPFCNFVNKPSITGWGGEGLNTRLHTCKSCGNDYTVVVYTEASVDLQISSMHLSSLRSQIRTRKAQIREMERGLVSKATGLGREYIRVEASTGGTQN